MAKLAKTPGSGRKKGSLNKVSSEVRQDFLKAWNAHGGPAVASRLLKAGIDRAMGYEVVEKSYEYQEDPQNPKKRIRVLVKEKVTREFSSELLRLCLPYFAQEMPRLSEVTGRDGAPLVPLAPALPQLDMSKWTEAQIDRFIEATTVARPVAPVPNVAP